MRSFGPYTLLNRLSSGTIGDAFLAQVDPPEMQIISGSVGFDEESEDLPSIGSRAVLRILKTELLKDITFMRLLNTELQALGDFSHPSLLRPDGPLREAEGVAIRTAVEGAQDLGIVLKTARLEGLRFDPHLITFIGAEVAAALAAAHQRNWFKGAPSRQLHGSVSPTKVLVTFDGRVLLLGLGYGRARLHLPPSARSLSYAPPERIDGAEPATGWDVYGLGVMLYDGFTGGRVYRGTSEDATRSAVRAGGAPSLAEKNTSVNAEVAAVIDRMIAVNPIHRPQEMAEVASILRSAAPVDAAAARRSLGARMQRLFASEIERFERVRVAAQRAGQRPKSVASVRPPIRARPPRPEPMRRPQSDPGFAGRRAPLRVVERNTMRTATPLPGAPVPGAPIEEAPTLPPVPRAASGPGLAQILDSELESPQALNAPIAQAAEPVELASPIAPLPVAAPPGESKTDPGDEGRSRPQRLARYVLRREIGRSQTTTTHLAKDPNLSRRVVVTLMDPNQVSDPRLPATEWVSWFKKRARRASELVHPNIVRLYDAGREGKSFFLVHEFVEGEELGRMLAKGDISGGATRLRIATQLTSAVAYLHRQQVLHCDLRATNVLIDQEGDAKLYDFSIASGVDDAPHPLLADNSVAYAPETVAGGAYDPQAEQFALGALLYELVVGERPFVGADRAEVRQQIVTKAPEFPESARAGLPPAMLLAVQKMLAKSPSERFANLEEAIAELEAIRSGAEVEIKTDPDIPDEARRGTRVIVDTELSELVAGTAVLGPAVVVSDGFEDALAALRSAGGGELVLPRGLVSEAEVSARTTELGLETKLMWYEPPRARATRLAPAPILASFVAMIERVQETDPDRASPPLREDAQYAATSVARRLGFSRSDQLSASFMVSVRRMAERTGISLDNDLWRMVVPDAFRSLMRAVERIHAGEPETFTDANDDVRRLARGVLVVERYFDLIDPAGSSHSPRKALLKLREETVDPEDRPAVEALLQHFQEIISALDLPVSEARDGG